MYFIDKPVPISSGIIVYTCTSCEVLCKMDISPPDVRYYETEWMCCDCGNQAIGCIKAGGLHLFRIKV